jgi:hypothetical protein
MQGLVASEPRTDVLPTQDAPLPCVHCAVCRCPALRPHFSKLKRSRPSTILWWTTSMPYTPSDAQCSTIISII